MTDAAALTGFIGIILAVVYCIFILLIPIFLYYIQKWTYRSYLELRQIKEHLNHLPNINKD